MAFGVYLKRGVMNSKVMAEREKEHAKKRVDLICYTTLTILTSLASTVQMLTIENVPAIFDSIRRL